MKNCKPLHSLMLWWGSYPNLNAYIILILICTDIHSGQCLCRPNCDSNIQWRNPMIVPCIRMIFAYYVYIFLHIQYGPALLILFSCFCFECPENNWFSWRTIGVSWVALWPAVSWFCGSCPSFPLCKCQLFSYQITFRHNWSKRHAQTMQSRKCLNRFLCSPLRCCLHVKKNVSSWSSLIENRPQSLWDVWIQQDSDRNFPWGRSVHPISTNVTSNLLCPDVGELVPLWIGWCWRTSTKPYQTYPAILFSEVWAWTPCAGWIPSVVRVAAHASPGTAVQWVAVSESLDFRQGRMD